MTVDNSNRRVYDRYEYAAMVGVLPVGPNKLPVGQACSALSKDISKSGIRLECFQPITSSHLIVELTTVAQKKMWVFATVVRSVKNGMVYEVAGDFAERLDEAYAGPLFHGVQPVRV